MLSKIRTPGKTVMWPKATIDLYKSLILAVNDFTKVSRSLGLADIEEFYYAVLSHAKSLYGYHNYKRTKIVLSNLETVSNFIYKIKPDVVYPEFEILKLLTKRDLDEFYGTCYELAELGLVKYSEYSDYNEDQEDDFEL